MTDDIVTRLREQALEGIWDFTQASFDMQNAADEIERLRELVKFHNNQLRQIRNAIYDEGINPAYHQYVMRKQRKEWPTLWEALDEAMKDLAQKPSRYQ